MNYAHMYMPHKEISKQYHECNNYSCLQALSWHHYSTLNAHCLKPTYDSTVTIVIVSNKY